MAINTSNTIVKALEGLKRKKKMATTLYGALLGLWLVILSLRVIALRGGPGMGWLKFGYTGEPD